MQMGSVVILNSLACCTAPRLPESAKLGSGGLATSVFALTSFLKYKIDVAKKSSNKGLTAVQKSSTDHAI